VRTSAREAWSAVADETDEANATGRGVSERLRVPSHVVDTQETWGGQGKALADRASDHARLYGRIAAGRRNPEKGHYSDELAWLTGRVQGLDRRVRWSGRSTRWRCHRIATTSKLDDERLAIYRDAGCVRDQPATAQPPVGGGGQHGVRPDIDEPARIGWHPEQSEKSLGQEVDDSHQGRADSDALFTVSSTPLGVAERPTEAWLRSG